MDTNADRRLEAQPDTALLDLQHDDFQQSFNFATPSDKVLTTTASSRDAPGVERSSLSFQHRRPMADVRPGHRHCSNGA